MGIISILITGLVVGALARLALPGPDPMSIWMTILLGIAGSLIGVVISLVLGTAGGLLFAVVGAALLLYLHRRFVQHRGLTGPRRLQGR
jgi:uncharacterized membrane protein YeaQ/YmgE (transglycosylase-associated protein family)